MGTVIDYLMPEFKKHGMDVEIFTKKILIPPKKGIKVHVVSPWDSNLPSILEKYDLVHVNGGSSLTLMASRAKVPKMFTFHGQTPPWLHKDPKQVAMAFAIEALYKYAMRKFDLVAATSHFGQQDIRKRFGVKQSICIPDGVDRRLFRKYDSKEISQIRKKNGHPLFLGVGNLYPVKDWEGTLDLFKKILPEMPDASLLIAGEGILKGSLLKKIRRDGLARNAHLLGRVQFEELPKYYNASDAYFSGSPYEGFCLPAIEALSCGKPLLVAHQGAMIEHALKSGCGATFTDSKSLVLGAKKVLGMDPIKIERRANSYLKDFTWNGIAKQYVQAYEKLLK
jgi:glycosyltransferase involved in cell wall biosynthesis